MRVFNPKYFLKLLAITATAGAAIWGIHYIQVRRQARAFLVLADRAVRGGELAKAEEYLLAYLVYQPKDIEALARLGRVTEDGAQTAVGRYNAVSVYHRVLQLDPERSSIRRRTIKLEMDPELQGAFSARSDIDYLLSKSPRDGELLALLAQCDEESGRFADAIKSYTKAKAAEPSRVETYVRSATLLRERLDQPAEADRWMTELVEKNPKSAAAYLGRAEYRERWAPSASDSDLAGARADLARAQELAPDNAKAYLQFARLEGRRAKPDQAKIRAALARGMELDPRDYRFYDGMAQLERAAGRPKAATAILRGGIAALAKAGGGSARGRGALNWLLADLLIDSGELTDARAAVESLKSTDVSPIMIELLDARILLASGKDNDGRRALEKIAPRLEERAEWAVFARQVHLLLGRLYTMRGELDQAQAENRSILNRDPNDPDAMQGLAAAMEQTDQVEAAIERYNRLLPQRPAVAINLAGLLMRRNLRLAPRERRWPEVEAMIERAAQAAPDAPDVPILRAELLVQQGQVPRARELLRGAIAQHPDQQAIRLALAQLELRRGERDAVPALLDEAERASGDSIDLRLARAAYWEARGGAGATEALAKLASGADALGEAGRVRLLRTLADSLIRSGDRNAARKLLTELAERHLDSRLALFDLAVQDGDADAIAKAIASIREREGENGVYWRLAQAQRLISAAAPGRQGGLAEARRLLTAVLVQRPGWSRAVVAEAKLHEKAGDMQAATATYVRAILDLGVRDVAAVSEALKLLVERRRFGEAEQIIRRLQDESLDAPELRRLVANVSLQTGKLDRAVDLAQRTVGADSTDYHDHLWLGRILWLGGRFTDAEASLRRALALAPARPEPRVGLVQFLVGRGQKDAARQVAADGRAQLPAEEADLTLAQCAELLGDRDQADALFKAAEAARPRDGATLRLVADYYLRNGRSEDAERLLNRLVGLSSAESFDPHWARNVIALIKAGRGNYEQWREALEMLGLVEGKQVRARADEPVEDLRTKARALAAQPGRAQRRDAIALLEAIADRETPKVDDRLLLADLYDRDGAWPRAREHLRALVSASNSTGVLVLAGERFVAHRELGDAQRALAKLEAIDRDGFPTVVLRARILAGEGHGAEAGALLEARARQRPDEAGAMAALLVDLNQVAAAEALLRRLAAAATDPAATWELATFLARQGRVTDALDLCERSRKVAKLDDVINVGLTAVYLGGGGAEVSRRVERWVDDLPANTADSAQVLFWRATLRQLGGKYDEAAELFRKCIARDATSIGPRNNLALQLALSEGDLREALDLINGAIKLAGPTPALLDTRGIVYLKKGETQKAIADLDDAVAEAPSAFGYFHLAQAHLAAKNRTAAVAAWRNATERNLKEIDLHPLERPAFRQLQGELTGSGVAPLARGPR
jgi:tetratricopeptide (TPR) repeat protein